ncbi:hypothetical protein BDV95DRAFT_114956 [Massariosphaeria phaeospora]|uniref:BTB domain-containing protein n=1 Tax=Massariosphaeria phaeospora TaxID=100035 RepID=A0A7C8I2K7_9PLEO|nr:hypothetical protein BDV95DRAFT_114956 [Massariosphaeria phaeospora]
MAKFTDLRTAEQHAASWLDSPIIKICVAAESFEHCKMFYVHSGLICARSLYFRTTMNGRWLEADEQAVSLPEDDPAVVATYLGLLYTNRLHLPQTIHSQYNWLIRLYVFAERMMDTESKNIVVQAMMARAKEGYCPPSNAISTLYDGTPETSLARNLFVVIRYLCFKTHDSHDSTVWWNKELPGDFLFELGAKILKELALKPKGTDRLLLDDHSLYMEAEMTEEANTEQDKAEVAHTT